MALEDGGALAFASPALRASETRFFDAGRVVQLGAPAKATAVCGASQPYYEVAVHLPQVWCGLEQIEQIEKAEKT